MAETINWHCPHCHHKVTITSDRRSRDTHVLEIDAAQGKLAFMSEFRVCPNQECQKASLTATLANWRWHLNIPGTSKELVHPSLGEWSLIPRSNARQFSDCVPQAIRDDYEEGCLIRDLSPKASATIARRALQGILRDFYSVRPGRLIDEIKQVRDTMDAELWAAIEGVRTIGNIGAHMEHDIDLIVDVDPGEAQLLLELVETMVEETYVRREQRRRRLARVATIAGEKAAARRPSSTEPAESPAIDRGSR